MSKKLSDKPKGQVLIYQTEKGQTKLGGSSGGGNSLAYSKRHV